MMRTNPLLLPIDTLSGVGPARAKLIREQLKVQTWGELLTIFPHRYIDRTTYHKIADLVPSGSDVQVIGRITYRQEAGNNKSKRLIATFVDDTGSMELVWFRSTPYLKKQLVLNQQYVAFGKLNYFNGKYSIAHPELELLSEHKSRMGNTLQPVYPSTEVLSRRQITSRTHSKWIEQILKEALHHVSDSLLIKTGKNIEISPFLEPLNLMPKAEAMRAVHFPQGQEELAQARYRLKFEELFYLQMQLLMTKQVRKGKIKGYVFDKVGTHFNSFYKNQLPFELTGAQKRVVKEIRNDMATGAQMNRLLQGDVGSGKTIVALLSCLLAMDNGFQAVVMAPTEILAQQHMAGMSELLEGTKVNIALLTGSVKKRDRMPIHAGLLDGTINILVGTHAVLEDKVQFKNLGLSVIDEQHRFGVAQRAKLYHKNERPPHVLVMTATPIPRTLQMTVYGDLDVSIIDELPPGRKEIKTVHRNEAKRLSVIGFIRDEIKKGRQIYIVYPLIEESETLDYKNLMEGFNALERDFPEPEYQISIVHGKLSPEAKDFQMQRFIKHETQIMIATTVIEVGVNVPNASVMIIESAERFGLSQLHQLRGRVGRGADQSYCILMTGHKLSEEARTRLETMCRTSDGFEIAAVDLRLRGPGDIMGTQQSGLMNLKMADVVKDKDILAHARHVCEQILTDDPLLQKPVHDKIAQRLRIMMRRVGQWKYIS